MLVELGAGDPAEDVRGRAGEAQEDHQAALRHQRRPEPHHRGRLLVGGFYGCIITEAAEEEEGE